MPPRSPQDFDAILIRAWRYSHGLSGCSSSKAPLLPVLPVCWFNCLLPSFFAFTFHVPGFRRCNLLHSIVADCPPASSFPFPFLLPISCSLLRGNAASLFQEAFVCFLVLRVSDFHPCQCFYIWLSRFRLLAIARLFVSSNPPFRHRYLLWVLFVYLGFLLFSICLRIFRHNTGSLSAPGSRVRLDANADLILNTVLYIARCQSPVLLVDQLAGYLDFVRLSNTVSEPTNAHHASALYLPRSTE